jgi:hypothetical protein
VAEKAALDYATLEVAQTIGLRKVIGFSRRIKSIPGVPCAPNGANRICAMTHKHTFDLYF